MKFCKKCGCDTERYADGRCKPCDNARSAARRANYPEKVKAKQAAYHIANADRINAKSKAYRLENSEKVRAYSSAWAKNNLETNRIYSHNRRARELAAGGKLSKGLSDKLFELQRGKCACCGLPLGDDFHLDHIMPLKLGGTNTDDNIQLLRATCNLQKNAKDPIKFMQSRGKLL